MLPEAVLKRKEGKACDLSGIIIEMVKAGGDVMLDVMTGLINLIIKEEQIPDKLHQSIIINCFKGEGDATRCDKYRGY